MRELWTCPINGGSCRPATEEERLDWDRREYLRLLMSDPDRPELQHLFPEHLRKFRSEQISFPGWEPEDVASFMRS